MEIGDPVAVRGDHHGLVLAQFDCATGVFDECRHVGADEHLAIADPHHQRRGPAGGDDGAGLVGVGEHQGEVALQPAQHGQHGAGEVAGCFAVTIGLGHQVHCDLGVGVAGEFHTGRLQLMAQGREVLDDAVVDDGDLAGGVAVRVRIAVGGAAVGRPAGVAQAGAAGPRIRRHLGHGALEVGQPAGATSDSKFAVTVDQGESRRVVAAVLHPAQRVHDDLAGGAPPDVADNSAHSDQGSASDRPGRLARR